MPGPPACGQALMSMNRSPAYGLKSNVITWMADVVAFSLRQTDGLAPRMIHKYLDNGEAPSSSVGTADLLNAGTAKLG